MKRVKEFFKENPISVIFLIVFVFAGFIAMISAPTIESNRQKIETVANKEVDMMKHQFGTSTFVTLNEVTLGTIKIKIEYSEFVKTKPNPNFIIYDIKILPRDISLLHYKAIITFYLIQDGVVFWTEKKVY